MVQRHYTAIMMFGREEKQRWCIAKVWTTSQCEIHKPKQRGKQKSSSTKFCSLKLRGVIKKRIFYGQAGRKGWLPLTYGQPLNIRGVGGWVYDSPNIDETSSYLFYKMKKALTDLQVSNVDYDIATQTKEHLVIVCTDHCVFSFQAQCSVTKNTTKEKNQQENIILRQIWYTSFIQLILVAAAQKSDSTAKRSIMPNNGWKKVG